MLKCGDKKRILPVESGIAYAVLNEVESDNEIVIGSPFTADCKDIRITVSGNSNYSEWRAEIHNPTDKTVKTVIKSNPDFTGYTKVENITLAPGAVVIREFK